jgi:hypothetical protein
MQDGMAGRRESESRGGPEPERRGRGFAHAAGLLGPQMRDLASRRGFSDASLLTRWDEIAGPALAPHCRPLRISRATDGAGGVLHLLAAPGRGPELTASAPLLVERVNAALGHRAVSRIRLTQTAAEGFAEGQSPFAPAPPPRPEPALAADTRALLGAVEDEGLRMALERLGKAVAERAAGLPRETKKGYLR